MPSGVRTVMSRIAELSAPPPAVARFATTLAQATSGAAAAPKAPAAVTAAAATPTTAQTATHPAADVSAQRSVTPQVGRSLAAARSAAATASDLGALPAAAAPWRDEIVAAARAGGVDPDLLTALVWVESSFQPDAVSPAGAIGLAQLMPDTAKSLGVDPWDPVQNLQGSARMLHGLIEQFGRVDHALAAYNVGPNGLARGLAQGRTPGLGYARAVAAKYHLITGRELFE